MAEGRLEPHDDTLAEELAIVRRAASGDQYAFQHLYTVYRERVYAVFRRYIRSKQDCEDLFQEAFLKAWKELGRFRGDSRFGTWLIAIAQNTCWKHLEKIERRRNLNAVYEAESVLARNTTDRFLPEKNEMKSLVWQCLGRLPEEQKQCCQLYMQRFSYEEIASALNLREGQARGRIQRGLVSIERCVKKFLGIEE